VGAQSSHPSASNPNVSRICCCPNPGGVLLNKIKKTIDSGATGGQVSIKLPGWGFQRGDRLSLSCGKFAGDKGPFGAARGRPLGGLGGRVGGPGLFGGACIPRNERKTAPKNGKKRGKGASIIEAEKIQKKNHKGRGDDQPLAVEIEWRQGDVGGSPEFREGFPAARVPLGRERKGGGKMEK